MHCRKYCGRNLPAGLNFAGEALPARNFGEPGNMLYFPWFGELQPCETWKFRICSESVSRVLPDLVRISLWTCLTRTRVTTNRSQRRKQKFRKEKGTQTQTFWSRFFQVGWGSPMLSVLKRCVLKTLAFAFGLRLRSKTRCFKTRVLGRRLPNGKPQERLRFRALRGKTLAFRKRIAIVFAI